VTPFSVVAAGGFGGVVAVTFLSPRVSLGIGAPVGPVAVEGDGTLALDGEMRLIGAGTANISGFDQAIEQLVASGHLAARDAPLAKLGFTALAKPDPKTGVATVSLPVTAENGFLYLGPLKIAALKPIRLD